MKQDRARIKIACPACVSWCPVSAGGTAKISMVLRRVLRGYEGRRISSAPHPYSHQPQPGEHHGPGMGFGYGRNHAHLPIDAHEIKVAKAILAKRGDAAGNAGW